MLKVLTTSILMALPAIESFAYTPEDRAAGGAPPRKKARVTDGARAPARARAPPPAPAAIASRSFGAALDPARPPHTLILGSHPSTASLAAAQYYARRTNAFWWVAADCLGFRRGDGAGGALDPPAGVAPRHASPALGYADALRVLNREGFALWDVVGSCRRAGSTDAAIERASEVPNDVRALCAAWPSIERVCLASGATTAALFARHNARWLREPGRFALADDAKTRRALGRVVPDAPRSGGTGSSRPITLCVMASVSPAFCRPPNGTYAAKLADWERLCFCER